MTTRTAAALLVLALAVGVSGAPARGQAPAQAVVAISNLPPRLQGVSLAVAAQDEGFVVPGGIGSLSAFFKSLPRWKER